MAKQKDLYTHECQNGNSKKSIVVQMRVESNLFDYTECN